LAPHLTYTHSSGAVDTKASYIAVRWTAALGFTLVGISVSAECGLGKKGAK